VRRTYISPSLYINYNHQSPLLLPAACRLVYFHTWLIHHKLSWNFTVKLGGLSHLSAAWCNMSWTWNLITVVISRTKNKFYCLSKVHYTQSTSWVKGLYERLSLIFPGILPEVKFHKICLFFWSSDITKHVWGASPRLFWNCFP